MMIPSLVFLAVLAMLFLALGLYVVGLYNHLVSLKHNIDKAFSNIEVLLKQRHDELPKLVAVCKRYMTYEDDTFERITQARNQVSNAQKSGDITALGVAETAMRSSLGSLFMVAEDYPDLKADTSFAHLQSRISELEEAISDRREFYNESVNVNNIGVEQFPANLVAGRFGFKSSDLLEFDEAEIADVNNKLFL